MVSDSLKNMCIKYFPIHYNRGIKKWISEGNNMRRIDGNITFCIENIKSNKSRDYYVGICQGISNNYKGCFIKEECFMAFIDCISTNNHEKYKVNKRVHDSTMSIESPEISEGKKDANNVKLMVKHLNGKLDYCEIFKIMQDIRSFYAPVHTRLHNGSNYDGKIPGNHRSIIFNSEWQRIYGAQPKKFEYYGGPGKEELAMPCHYCGLWLPIESLQVDHQAPQNSKDQIKHYIAKVFGMLGSDLTAQKASGAKYSLLKSSLGNKPVTPRSKSIDWQLKNINQDRYKLTDAGEIIAYFLPNEEWCKDSLLNLAPACGRCNLAKSNQYHKPRT